MGTMKKLIVFLLVAVLLVGCQNDEEKIEEKDAVDNRPLHLSNAKPRQLQLLNEVTINYSEVIYYCWKESLGECPAELNNLYYEDLDNLFEQPTKKSIPVTLHYDTYTPNPLPLPDKEELFLFNDGTFTPVEIVNRDFMTPVEEGVYTYVYKATFDSENAQGVAFYAFKLKARD